MDNKIYFLVHKSIQSIIKNYIKKNHIKNPVIFTSSLQELSSYTEQVNKSSYLFVFGIGEILPISLVNRFSLAINIHPGLPQYPGRDPYHFAAYDQILFYGATAHFMDEKVDSGHIVDLEIINFDKPKNSIELLEIANLCSIRLLKRLLSNLIIYREEIKIKKIKWNKIKRSRKDFINLCKIDITISKEELDRKYQALQQQIEQYKNLYIDIQGYRFRFERKL